MLFTVDLFPLQLVNLLSTARLLIRFIYKKQQTPDPLRATSSGVFWWGAEKVGGGFDSFAFLSKEKVKNITVEYNVRIKNEVCDT